MVTEGFAGELTLSGVAKRLHITPEYLSGSFKKHMNLTFSNFLTYTRLNYAAELFSDGDLTVTEVCCKCGYRNLSHFLRSLKKDSA